MEKHVRTLAEVVRNPSRAELEAAHCWENDDRAGTPEMTAFRRHARYAQALWREDHGHPVGTQPIVPQRGKPVRPLGNRLPLDYAERTGATFVDDAARDAAVARRDIVEPHQVMDHQRTWADLLWSPALAFNLFGGLAADLRRTDRAVHTWWSDAPGRVSAVRFLHSPGRLDMAFLGNLGYFDTAFELDLGDGTLGIVAVQVRYHQRTKRREPKPVRLGHYVDVMRRTRLFRVRALDAVNNTELTETWLDHLLLHSMLLHPSGRWRWGRFVYVHPEGNIDHANAVRDYAALLQDDSTFASLTLEALVGSRALGRSTTKAIRERYLRY